MLVFICKFEFSFEGESPLLIGPVYGQIQNKLHLSKYSVARKWSGKLDEALYDNRITQLDLVASIKCSRGVG